jgi:ornithine carbamoyltransferase
MKDLLRITDLTSRGLHHALSLAIEAKRVPHRWPHLLEGETVVLCFAEPSTRTRLSFETAVARLGGTPVVVGPDDLQLGRGETVEDTARVISRYAAAAGIRTHHHDDARRFAQAASIPVVNLLTGGHHPCQALADLMTMQEHFGRLEGLKVAYIGDGDNIAHSLLEACALAGVDITVATPPEYEPDRDVIARAEVLAELSGSIVVVEHDPILATAGADVIYADTWMSLGVAEDERPKRAAAFRGYRIDDSFFTEANDGAVFLHCLPAFRGEDVTAAVIDGPRSLVFEQAANSLATAQGLLVGLLEGTLEGSGDMRRENAHHL